MTLRLQSKFTNNCWQTKHRYPRQSAVYIPLAFPIILETMSRFIPGPHHLFIFLTTHVQGRSTSYFSVLSQLSQVSLALQDPKISGRHRQGLPQTIPIKCRYANEGVFLAVALLSFASLDRCAPKCLPTGFLANGFLLHTLHLPLLLTSPWKSCSPGCNQEPHLWSWFPWSSISWFLTV